jgi:hypothetical protein
MSATAQPSLSFGCTGVLPNLLVIGAAKSGTTSLHHYLDAHPEISMAAPSESGDLLDNDAGGKEMRFFWRSDWRDRLEWYQSHFEHMDTPVRGETTPAYAAYPFHSGVAERIHEVVPSTLLLYIVRDPIERIAAHYVQMKVDDDPRSFADWMRDYDQPDNQIVCPSRYATQVERYLDHFDSSQILVVDQHELRVERQATLRRIFEFVGVDVDFWSPSFDQRRNTQADKYALTPLGRRLFKRAIDPAGRRLMSRRWRTWRSPVRRAFSKRIADRPTIEGEMRGRLVAMLQPEVDRLRELTGQRFEHWSL